MPYCPNCGKEIDEKAKFCGNCGFQLAGNEQKEEATKEKAPIGPTSVGEDAISSLRRGVNIISAKPTVLLPTFIGAFISAFLSFIATWFFIPYGIWNLGRITPGMFIVGLLLMLIGGIISYIMAFASLDMSRNAFLDKELNLGKSIDYVLKRILTFIVASIVGAILAITVILIPVVTLMFVIMVVDEIGIKASLSQTFKVLGDRLGDIIILIIIGIAGSLILGLIPFFGSILVAAFNVLIALAYIDLYFHYKKTI